MTTKRSDEKTDKLKPQASAGTSITPRMGDGFLSHWFGGGSYIKCVIELVKDARDWHAGKLWIDTRDKTRIEFRDDGDGMDQKNRDAFASVSCTTANQPGQQGRYGSGSKYMLFSFATHVEVLTASKEEPGLVYRFAFDTRSYEERVMKGLPIVPETLAKTSQSWPFPHLFGTVIRYVFRDPRARGIMRGEALSNELTARLPCKFSEIVEVDGKSIPAKEIIGQRLELIQPDAHLGDVAFELYRPKRKRREEGLFVTGGEVGEVPFSNLYRVLGELSERVPPVFNQQEVCGTIRAQFLRDYVNEDRFTISPAVTDTPLMLRLLLILDRVAPRLQQCLELKVEKGSSDERHTAALEEVASMFSDSFEKSAPPPPTEDDPTVRVVEPVTTATPEEKPPLVLEAHREYEVGQAIEITARVRKDLTKTLDPKDIRWQTARSRARDVQITDTGIKLVADEIGPGMVSADLPGTPYGASVHYAVVTAREFKLSIPHATIPRGSQIWVMGVHTDKLVGEIRWTHKGPGEMEVNGNRATYYATRVGRAEIRAYDSKRPEVSASCEITVEPVPPKTFPVRDQRFKIATHRVSGRPEFAKPVTMQLGSGSNHVHNMIINVMGHGYQNALERGDPAFFLAHAIAMEFARFQIFELHPQDDDHDPRDAATLANDVLNEGFKLIAEVMEQSLKSGKK